ncbi:MAG: hypothetical protein J1F05_06355 [Muribaculaceae bacterium]|nr:hypothetical protein [Muribaculaceae bacterium]
MFFVFLIIILLFILWPVLRTGWKIHRFMSDPVAEMRRQAEKRQKEYKEQYASNDEYQQRPHKKIDADVGEYVTFTEIEISEEERQNRAQQSDKDFRREEQISDAKWVDINE